MQKGAEGAYRTCLLHLALLALRPLRFKRFHRRHHLFRAVETESFGSLGLVSLDVLARLVEDARKGGPETVVEEGMVLGVVLPAVPGEVLEQLRDGVVERRKIGAVAEKKNKYISLVVDKRSLHMISLINRQC